MCMLWFLVNFRCGNNADSFGNIYISSDKPFESSGLSDEI